MTRRIVVMLGISTVLLLGVEAFVTDHMVDAEMHKRFDSSLVLQAQAMAALIEYGPHGLSMEVLRPEPSHMLLGTTHSSYAVFCANGMHLQSRPLPAGVPRDWVDHQANSPAFANVEVDGVPSRAVLFRFSPDPNDQVSASSAAGAGPVCRFLLLRSRDQLDNILYVIDAILLLTPLLALLAVLLLSPVLVRRGLKPLAMLGDSIRSIGPNAPGQRLEPATTRELTPLTVRFNEVLERMDEGMARERRFAGALAHETRTRLAELRALVDIERRHPSGRSAREILDDVSDISGELEGTVAGLLLLTRLEAGLEHVEQRSVDMQSLVVQQLELVEDGVQRRQMHIHLHRPEASVSLVTDATLLGMIVGNLLRNAVAYAPSAGRVDVAWDAGALVISNAAPDLTAEEVVHLGQRHWRKLSQNTEGHAGLGLSLADAAATALGFRLCFMLDAGQRLHARLLWGEDD
jgi:signal transduction histidine kinase